MDRAAVFKSDFVSCIENIIKCRLETELETKWSEWETSAASDIENRLYEFLRSEFESNMRKFEIVDRAIVSLAGEVRNGDVQNDETIENLKSSIQKAFNQLYTDIMEKLARKQIMEDTDTSIDINKLKLKTSVIDDLQGKVDRINDDLKNNVHHRLNQLHQEDMSYLELMKNEIRIYENENIKKFAENKRNVQIAMENIEDVNKETQIMKSKMILLEERAGNREELSIYYPDEEKVKAMEEMESKMNLLEEDMTGITRSLEMIMNERKDDGETSKKKTNKILFRDGKSS